MAEAWLTSEQAAARLGVKAETLYAYVSRGLVRSERTPGNRRSRYWRADVERLAGRQRAGGRAGALEIILETELTLLDPAGKLYYRGWDVEEAARDATFEEVASWLWTGTRDRVAFAAPSGFVAAARGLTGALRGVPPIDAMRAIVPVLRALDPLRDDRRPLAVAAAGRGLIATLVEAMPYAGGAPARPAHSVAARLWPRLSPRRPTAARVRILDAALVLLADHELAASTLGARVAASTWADPYLVVQAGLAALGGPLHGGASEMARRMIAEVRRGEATGAQAVGARLHAGAHVPGFGHSVYANGDPRANTLLAMLAAEKALPALPEAMEIAATMGTRGLPRPNVDIATATLAEAYDMVPGAGEIIFAVARIVGWLAHASEEYEHRLRFRPRAAYVGAPPSPSPSVPAKARNRTPTQSDRSGQAEPRTWSSP